MKKYKSVLLVDDNEIDILVSKVIIELAEVTEEICVARNGFQALNQVSEYYFKNKSLPEFILVDLVMPMMDGFKFIEELKRFSGYLRGDCKIIVLTASLENYEDKNRLQSLGVKDILLKPLD